jgi:hypothetical protein
MPKNKDVPCKSVVVSLSQATDSCDAGLNQEMLRQIGDTLFREDNVRLQTDQIVADLLDIFFFQLQNPRKVLLVGDLNVSLTFGLFIFEIAVQKNNSRIFDTSEK